jgi:hypothetical protein
MLITLIVNFYQALVISQSLYIAAHVCDVLREGRFENFGRHCVMNYNLELG